MYFVFIFPTFISILGYYFHIISEYFFSQEGLYLNPPEKFKELFSMKLTAEDLQ